MSIRVRMAPSPTGKLHLGTAYATLWPYLFARHNKGSFILRIEDTDTERSTKEFEENIIKGLQWLGFEWDEGPYHQMDRLEGYKKANQKLLDEGKAYYCFCTKEELEEEKRKQIEEKKPQIYSGKCRSLTKEEIEKRLSENFSYAVRFKLPEDRGIIEFEDIVHGKISVDSSLIGDIVIMRQNGIPLYNFAVVVDDIDMKITHIIRGDDHISNTPKQILFYEAFDQPLPIFAHYPVILNPGRIGKLSKRTGSTTVEEFQKDGYLPEALLNYLLLLGWSDELDRELFTKDEMIQNFAIEDLNKAPASWDQEKLDWLNGEYIRKMSHDDLVVRLEQYLVDHPSIKILDELVPLTKDRMKKLSDFIFLTDFIFEEPEYDLGEFKLAKLPESDEEVKIILERIGDILRDLKKPMDPVEFERAFRKFADDLELPAGDIFQLIRIAISGQKVTPPLFETIQIMGEDKAIKRVRDVAKMYPNFPNLVEDEKVETANQ